MKSNYIINPSDPRYGKLGHIWRKYKWEEYNLFRYFEGYNSIFYFIPPELVIKDYITLKIDVRNKLNNSILNSNWISNRSSWVIEESTGLTPQELFDITVLHINNKQDRPRCSYCKKYLNWSDRYSHAYYGDSYWNTRKFHYDSLSCRTLSMRTNIDYYKSFNKSCNDNIKYILDPITQIKSGWRRFLNMGDPSDQCYFYRAVTEDNFLKYGVTSEDLVTRSRQELWKQGYEYKFIKGLFIKSRVYVANLEALLKLKFNGSEYLNQDLYSKFIKYLIKFRVMNLDLNYEFDQLVKISTSTTIS